MPIPDFQSLMLPLLQYLGDNKEHSNQEILEAMEQYFRLTEQEKAELLPSGKQRIYVNRVAWAKSHLKKAGLIQSPGRGLYAITPRGIEELENAPDKLTITYLLRYPEFQAFREGKAIPSTSPETNNENQTPEELIELGHEKIAQDLRLSLLEQIKSCSPRFFEQLVIDLLLEMGYGGSRKEAGTLTQQGADGGIDGIINEDRLGLDVIYVQAKRWECVVGRPEIQKFSGALLGKRAKKGIFITTSGFTKDAVEYAQSIDSRLVLIDGKKLTELMIECNIGVSISQTYTIKKLDSDYFIE